jgi:two-component system OmpR family sensor kinase
MLRTLHGKLSIALLTLLIVVGLFHVAVASYTTRTYTDEVNQNLNRALASDLAHHLVSLNLLRSAPQVRRKTKAEIKQNMVLNPDIEIYILGADGAIIDYSGTPGSVRLKRVSLDPVRRFLAAQRPLPIVGDDPRRPGRQKIFSAARIPLDTTGKAPDRLKGYIYIILGGEKYDAIAAQQGRSRILRLGIWSIAGSLSLVAFAGVLLFGFLTRRLSALTQQMEVFQQESVMEGASAPASSTRLTTRHGGDEIERMRSVFVQMSERILAQKAQREDIEARRRESVTNVSHDLRTPLAALQGYLETLLIKEGKLSADEQRDYHLTALKHAERLGKLVAELFELSKLDSHEMEPAWENFSLAELAQDVMQQFTLTAQNKDVRLETHCSPDLPFVRADIGLVERALENLIENALHYTPPGGSITLSLSLQNKRIQVEVADTGQGIAPEHLPYIFDRTYRVPVEVANVEVANEEAPHGAGLGLAITQRIVELHGGAITVRSTLGAGSAFSFSLPLARPITLTTL